MQIRVARHLTTMWKCPKIDKSTGDNPKEDEDGFVWVQRANKRGRRPPEGSTGLNCGERRNTGTSGKGRSEHGGEPQKHGNEGRGGGEPTPAGSRAPTLSLTGFGLERIKRGCSRRANATGAALPTADVHNVFYGVSVNCNQPVVGTGRPGLRQVAKGRSRLVPLGKACRGLAPVPVPIPMPILVPKTVPKPTA